MDYEFAYAQRRAAEERRAARLATNVQERDSHLLLARAFEEHTKRLQPTSREAILDMPMPKAN